MYDYLINHALKNVWCTPDQDRQVVFAPTRLTGPRGVNGTVSVAWSDLPLPDPTSVYHVFQIGQVSPALLNLMPDRGIWRLAAEHMKNEAMIIDIYLGNGMMLPRIETYILVTWTKNIIVAIKDQNPLFDLTKDQPYIRLYSNAFYDSPRDAALPSDHVDIFGARITSQQQALNLQRKMQQLQQQPGLVTAYVDGWAVDSFNPFSVHNGQLVEFVYDSSVKRVEEWKISTLSSFTSTLDSLMKYILHYPGMGDSIIDYLDDVDFYVINRNQPGPVPAFKGVYFHKNNPNAVRQLTHKDYSIVVPYLVEQAQNVPGWGDTSVLTIRAHIRNSGYSRTLISDASRIEDLYRMPDVDLMGALSGTMSSLPIWKAAALEAAAYPAIMGLADPTQLTISQVEAAYGYGTISRILGDGPIQTVSNGGIPVIPLLPYGLRQGSTMLEYDNTGKLLGFYYFLAGYAYTANNPNCAWVEGIVGQGGSQLSTTHDINYQTLDPTRSYRYYKCKLVNNQPDGNWIDTTGSADYVIVNNQVVWQLDPTIWVWQVRDDSTFLAYTYTMTPSDGRFLFSITSTEQWNGQLVNGPMTIPPGQLTLFLNGHIMIENLDYTVQWPQVCINNKAFLKYNTDGSVAQQVVTVIGTGFCNTDLSRDLPEDVGFVSYGEVSRNSYFNVRDDKVLRIGVNGGVYPRSLLEFSEDYPTGPMSNITNGVPYSVQTLVVPTLNNTDQNTYALLAPDKALSVSIEEYMTQYLPDGPETPPDLIPNLYDIYSPFCAKVLFDLMSGVINMAPYMGQYSDLTVKNALQAYTYLLPFDPCLMTIDRDHVNIHPHNLVTTVSLTIYQYTFLERAINVFLNNQVDLTKFVTVLPTLI